jgi:formylglycine-generating enzyme required for sulfatase activity
VDLYRNDEDPGIHGAAEWLMRQWQADGKLKEIDRQLAPGKVEGKRRWYINREGQTMVVVPKPGVFWMEEIKADGSIRHKHQIDRSFAIASREVTEQQYRDMMNLGPPDEGTGDYPKLNVSWYDAVKYCNMLSQKENIRKAEWCYIPIHGDTYDEGMKMAPGYLHKEGYRLPTEAEWEFACRAGADTKFSFGEPSELLGKYGWFMMNSDGKSHRAGALRSNDLGLFDMHGNAWEWIHDAYKYYPKNCLAKDIEDKVDMERITNSRDRGLRGGRFRDPATYLCSGFRSVYVVPTSKNLNSGFRPARTVRE